MPSGNNNAGEEGAVEDADEKDAFEGGYVGRQQRGII